MRILDEKDNEIQTCDLDKGYTTEEEINTTFHEAQEEMEEKSHYEVIKEYPNGGKDLKKVIDQEYVPAHEAYYDKETILRYHPYSKEELEKIEEQNKELKRQSLIPTNSDLSDSAVDLGQGISDNEDALAELGDYASQLEDRIKSQDDTIAELVDRIKALEGKDNG